MNKDRKEYLKQYRLSHKDKYREYNKKYKETHLTTYQKLKQQNKELHNKIDKAIDLLQQYIPNYASCIKLLDELEEILKDSDVDE